MGRATFQLPIRRTPRCVLPTNATHYLTNCTRALRFFGSLDLRLATLLGAEKIDAFSRRLRSLPREALFLRTRIVRSRGLVPLRFSRFVILFRCRLHVFAWLSGYEKRDRDQLVRAPVKGDANILDPKRVPPMCARALERLSPIPALPPFRKENELFLLAAVPDRLLLRVAAPDLPPRAVAPAHAFCAPLFVGVVGSRFVFRGVSPEEKSINRQSSTSATESDARARPGLPYLLRSSRAFLSKRRSAFRLDEPRAGVPAVRVCKEPCHLAASSAEPLARLCAAFFFPGFFPVLTPALGKAVTSSNCELAAQSNDGASRDFSRKAARAEASK